MKKAIIITLLAAMGMTLTACQSAAASEAAANDIASANVNVGYTEGENVQIPNPFVDCDTVEEAEDLCGMKISVPDSISGYGEKSISVMDKQMIQVMFTNDNDDMTFRKAFGSDDISGDYNEYSEKLTENVDGTDIEIRGNDGKYCGTVWQKDGYAYSVFSRNGISKEDMLHYVGVMMTEDDGEIMVGGDPDTYSPFPID